jgi:hypothetical protein
MDIRDANLYNHDTAGLAQDVLAWCAENGGNRLYRIALCGYEGEHNILETMNWTKLVWKSRGCYQHADNVDSKNKKNRLLERIWFSPACNGRGMFDMNGDA